jgi:hypothetical protein
MIMFVMGITVADADETAAMEGQQLDDVVRLLDIEVNNEFGMQSDDTEAESGANCKLPSLISLRPCVVGEKNRSFKV